MNILLKDEGGLRIWKICLIGLIYLVGIPSLLLAQETITGTVTDAQSGETLPGVNILVKGTTVGTSSDVQGQFEVTVPSLQDTLVVSFVGYQTQEFPLQGRTDIDIQLVSQTIQGEEMVVTAFGVEREKRALGFSSQEVKTEDLAKFGGTTVGSSLKGKLSGVQITETPTAGGSTGIIIRGANSLSGNNQPLIVVDGMPIDNQSLDAAGLYGGVDSGDGLAGIASENIKSINVLKGPTAAARYGSRATNGAVIITTKSGEGRTQGAGISVTSNVTVNQMSDYPTFQDKWGSGYSPNMGTTIVRGDTVGVIPSWGYDQWGPELDGRKVIFQRMPDLGPVPFSARTTAKERLSEFFQSGVTYKNNISYSGGDKKTYYHISASDLSNTGMTPNSSYNKNNVSLRVTSNITDKLKVEGKANYIRRKGNNQSSLGLTGSNAFQSVILIPPYVKMDYLKDYTTEEGKMRNWVSYPRNPYWIANELKRESRQNRIIGFLAAEYDFYNWLNLRVRTSTDTYADYRSSQTNYGTPWQENGAVSDKNYNVQQNSSKFMLTASGNIWKDLIDGTVTFGGNHWHHETELTGANGENLNLRGVYDISNAKNVNPIYDLSRQEINSLFVTGTLNYKDYLYLDLAGRNDWSSTLPPENRSFFYPSASLSFVFTDLLNIDSNILSFGKVRASYAQTGTDASPYMITSGYYLESSRFKGQQSATIGGTVPPLDLKNELTTAYEAGTNLKFFENRLGIDFTYYTNSTTNQILNIDVAHSSGFNEKTINAGEIRNKGIEFLVNATPIQASNFSWDMTFNFSKNYSEVVSLAPGVETYLLTYSSEGNIEARPGSPYGDIVGYEYKRNENGKKLIDSDGNWERSESNDNIVGNIQPDWTGGVGTTFRYKGFSLYALLDTKQGGDMFSHTKYNQMANGTGKFTEDRTDLVAQGVVKNEDGSYSPNTETIGAVDYYAGRAWGSYSEEFVVDGSYISLREASIKYSFQPELLSKTPFVDFSISIVGRNLVYLQRADIFETMGVSPESTYNRSASAQGYEAHNMALPRSLGARINLKF